MSAGDQRSSKDGARKPKKDRGAARRAKAATRSGGGQSVTRRTPSQDAANAWRQGISTTTAATVDEVTAHVQNVVLEQLESHQAFPPFVVVARRDGEYELHSPAPEDLQDPDPSTVLDQLRETVRAASADYLAAAVAFPASLPDRSGAPALITEVEHIDGVSLTVIQVYRLKGVNGAKKTYLEDAMVENRDGDLLR